MKFIKRKAENYKSVGIEGLKSGDFAIIYYKSKEHGDGERFVLVLNPNWEGYLHAIKLEKIDRGKILTILRKMGRNKKKSNDKEEKNERDEKRLARRRAVSIGNPYKFYHLRVKPVIKRLKESPYRTYQIQRIERISKFDYKV